jgi:hypothetical protein
MCSTAAQRIAEIGRAIDDLAAHAAPAAHPAPAASDTGPLVARLAELWALLAELDPEVARRLAGYQSLSASTDLWPVNHPGQPHPSTSHQTDGRDWPFQPPDRAVPAATLRRDGPLRPIDRTLSCRRSRPQAWRSRPGAAAPRPGAPRQS